jgi:hypothetical protein
MSNRKLSEKPSLTVGQSLWWVPSDRRDFRQARAATVEKIGRKWATLSNGHRIGLSDWIADGAGYSPPGKAWASEQSWRDQVELRAFWADTFRRLSYSGSPETTEQVQAIRDIFDMPPYVAKETGN